jgi:hypothetical protein
LFRCGFGNLYDGDAKPLNTPDDSCFRFLQKHLVRRCIGSGTVLYQQSSGNAVMRGLNGFCDRREAANESTQENDKYKARHYAARQMWEREHDVGSYTSNRPITGPLV